MVRTIDTVAKYVWDGRLGDELAGFDEYCAVMSEISESVEAAL